MGPATFRGPMITVPNFFRSEEVGTTYPPPGHQVFLVDDEIEIGRSEEVGTTYPPPPVIRFCRGPFNFHCLWAQTVLNPALGEMSYIRVKRLSGEMSFVRVKRLSGEMSFW